MTKSELLHILNFPTEWETFGMYPDELFKIQLSGYKPGNEAGSEHERCGAFHWWLRRTPNAEQLIKLAKLSWLDPDPIMGADVRQHIASAVNFNTEVENACKTET
ncbi:hypothetical protein HNP49_003206 [Pseudomonas fluvialis]|uniref:Uncharacterized protein n=1 Tax=Pseudomonas fluvialis TaxID=1793966 RepID=A0A7X0BUU2_9PSED|nr:hypothetical protein [Pseudomonas fluvialis]MBB6343018.1 hypothetical protein [Pseudomonas fluvialis]